MACSQKIGLDYSQERIQVPANRAYYSKKHGDKFWRSESGVGEREAACPLFLEFLNKIWYWNVHLAEHEKKVFQQPVHFFRCCFHASCCDISFLITIIKLLPLCVCAGGGKFLMVLVYCYLLLPLPACHHIFSGRGSGCGRSNSSLLSQCLS